MGIIFLWRCLFQVIPFWILDFRFWIVKQLVVIAFGYTSVAIIFEIGITSCNQLLFALLWSKECIFIGERENTKHAPPFPFPFSQLLLEV
jgi:hypothetical protein